MIVVWAVAIQIFPNLRVERRDYEQMIPYAVQNADALQLRLLSGDASTDEDFPVSNSYSDSLNDFLAFG